MRAGGRVAAALLLLATLVACRDDAAVKTDAVAPSGSSGETATVPPTPGQPGDPALAAAISQPVEDPVYPQQGDPGVDALHYDLDLTWLPDARLLEGSERLTMRATQTADTVRLDLSGALAVGDVRVDGESLPFTQADDDLVVEAPVEADQRYVVEVDYSGTPEPTEAPTTRKDMPTLGLTTTEDGEAWTMQEPFGAFTWYAVNDQPSDKALYDFTLRVPAPWVGVANGELVERTTEGGDTVTRWHLADPAASYLTTVAFGDLQLTTDESKSGVPISYWTPPDRADLLARLRAAPAGMGWLEERLGPYPYDTLGFLLVDSKSGMETQTMVTLGATDYATSPEVLVHEMAHHWYGNEVTPEDWRDVWMNEGMVMYIQGVWTAERDGVSVNDVMDYWASFEPELRRQSGPPGDYDPETFGESNVYYGPALMWHELRGMVGDEVFWDLVRSWPQEWTDANASREDYLPWLEERTGRELTAFFDAWLLGEQQPERQ